MNYAPNAQTAIETLRRIHAVDTLRGLNPFVDFDEDTAHSVLDEGAKLIGQVIAPLNRSGDEEGARWSQGRVTMPAGFVDAYTQFWQAGWPSLSHDTQWGGQGLPTVFDTIVNEWLNAANQAFNMAPGLLHGAIETIKHYASDELKERYLPKLVSGEWLATMCLTEPHAGSDLGLVRTKAAPSHTGCYRIDGEKIFISAGEHDLTPNIVHLVLARLPDAPPGPKGLSLFLAPKFLPDGTRNGMHCDRIEEKMGLHASSTCAMRFDGATGWLVGEPGRGLNAMFVMMNAARLLVAMQGIGTLDAAWQKADAYARQRKQMRIPGSGNEADFIVEHAAVKRALDTQRVWCDLGRVLAYQTAVNLDVARFHAEPAQRERAQAWCSLLTPILKAAWTQQGFEGASACLQVFGGHGYIREWGIEQHVRDVRVAMIYEGTNEIQANDLLLRKVLGDGGATMTLLLAECAQGPIVRQLAELTRELCATLRATDPRANAIAQDYLQACAVAMMEHALSVWPEHRDDFRRWVAPEYVRCVATIQAVVD